jgi:hypothetical protein
MGRLALGVAVCVVLAGCGSSGAGGAAAAGKGPETFVGRAPNAVMIVQWTRTGRRVSGLLREAIAKRGGRGVSSAAKSFTGTINGRGLSLRLGGEALAGQLEGNGFSLTLPGAEASAVAIRFQPGQLAEYDHGVEKLALAEYPSPCTLYLSGHEAEVEFTGHGAPRWCEHFVRSFAGQAWSTTETAAPAEKRTVCSLARGDEGVVVTDGDGQQRGREDCAALAREGWVSIGAGGAPAQSCGSLPGPAAHFAIATGDGVSCTEARRVFTDLFAGRGEKHQGRDAAESYTDVDGWACGSGAGGFGCRRSAASISATAE